MLGMPSRAALFAAVMDSMGPHVFPPSGDTFLTVSCCESFISCAHYASSLLVTASCHRNGSHSPLTVVFGVSLTIALKNAHDAPTSPL
jgi:hypothetical protein